MNPLMTSYQLIISLLLIFLLNACSGPIETNDSSIALSAPDFIADVRSIDKNALSAFVTVNGIKHSLSSSSSGQWSGTVTVSTNQSYTVTIEWYETLRGRELKLASASQFVEVGSSAPDAVQFSNSGYNTNFHADNDGITNISERRSDSNPFVDESVYDRADVIIPQIPTGESAPTMDGLYSTSEWRYATRGDKTDDTLHIRNLILINEGNDQEDKEPVHRWEAMHDGTYLYLAIFSDDQRRFGDSDNHWDDDNLNLYFDGDYSHGQQYDGVNDFHMLIPAQLRNSSSPNRNGLTNTRLLQGANSATLPRDLTWTVGHGRGPFGVRGFQMDVYEIRLRLSQLDITVGQLFGLDIHLDDDDDGGDRDSKWAWYRPSQTGSTSMDQTYFNASVMGAGVLER